MSDVAIRTTGLRRDFGATRALDGLSFEVQAGSVFGFLGPNGAGKTTTIRLLLGLIEPTSGSAEVLGFDSRRQADEVRGRCGALLEQSGLYERLSAEDNLEFYARAWRLPAAERRARIKELLTHVGLWERRREAAGSWSRGMKQKLAVARAMLHHPAVIFLDEPTAGLDPVASVALRDDLAALAEREGVTVFLTTHNLAEAERLCQQVAVIREGKLLATGRPDDLGHAGTRLTVLGSGFNEELLALLRAQPQVTKVQRSNGHLLLELNPAKAGGAGDLSAAALVSLMVAAGAQIEEVRRDKASLEDVFLTLVQEEKEE